MATLDELMKRVIRRKVSRVIHSGIYIKHYDHLVYRQLLESCRLQGLRPESYVRHYFELRQRHLCE